MEKNPRKDDGRNDYDKKCYLVMDIEPHVLAHIV